MTTTTDRIQVRRDTAANWTAANPTLTAGEWGYETDAGRLKIGNGATAWTALAAVGGVTSVNGHAGVVVLGAAEVGADATGAAAAAQAASQPLDSDLAAIAALVSAADKLAYATGVGTWALTDLTAAGRALIASASAGAELTTLGVSAFIQTLLDDADAATARATLGVSGSSLTSLADNTTADSAAIAADTETTVLTTASLAVGTWDVTMGTTLSDAAADHYCLARMVVGTATASFAGIRSVASHTSTLGVGKGGPPLHVRCIVTVTVAGTINLNVYVNISATAVAKSTPSTYPQATGYVAVKIA